MNKVKKVFTIILLFLFIFYLFKYNYIINTSVINATNLWLKKVFPSLFIMFILNDLIINTNILKPIINLISPLFNKIFTTTKYSCEAFILSIFSGTPSSAFIIKEMLNKHKITINDANKLIAFTYFSNPLFLYNILSITFNKFITFKIIIIHYLTNIVIGLFFRKKNIEDNITINNEGSKTNIFTILPTAINKSFNTMLMILGTITFYMIITNLIITIFPLNNFNSLILKGFLEITQCLNNLPILHTTSIIKEIIAIIIISFGGISIHTQIISLISDTDIKYKNFLYGRLIHIIFATMTYFLTYFIIHG